MNEKTPIPCLVLHVDTLDSPYHRRSDTERLQSCWAMAENFVRINRHAPMLFPLDLRGWVEDNDLAHAQSSRRDSRLALAEIAK